jgi:hypothetical protein
MHTKSVLSLLVMAAAVLTFAVHDVEAGFPAPPGIFIPPLPSVNVNVTGYIPAPPGVHVQVDAGRPYYVERERRVYMEREPQHHRKHYKKHHKRHHKHKRHHDDY